MGVCEYHMQPGMSRRVATVENFGRPLSEQVSAKAGRQSACIASVNDTYPDSLRDPDYLLGYL